MFPPTCCLCGAPGLASDVDLCEICLALLPRFHQPAQHAPTGLGFTLQAGASDLEAGFRLVVVPFLYAYPVAHFVRALKFRGERMYARTLGTLLAEARREIDVPLPDRIVPVPLHVSRYRERGFNQSHELARYAAAQLGVRVDGYGLVRALETREQSGLTFAERRRNVRGAFRAARRPEPHRVALVDDVLTTGSTAREAARALRRAGVTDIELWAIARAVPQ